MMQTEDSDSLQIVPDPDKLERYHRQQLSAMLDGELSPDQARFMLRRLQHDTALAGCWERWQVCGDMLRGQHNALLPSDFAQKVSAAIAGDTAPAQVRARKGSPRLLRWGGGAALAASVAMAALLVGRQDGIEPGGAAPQPSPAFAATGSQAPPADPAPIHAAPETAPQTAPATVAVTALAAAEATRRASESRARSGAQASDTASTRSAPRSVPAQRLAAAPATDPAPTTIDAASATARSALPGPAPGTALAALPAAADGIGADPFQALPMTVASRPWPRADVGAMAGYAVGLGSAMQGAPAWPRPLGPVRPPAVERFGLPANPAPQLAGATAIGTRPVPAEPATGPAPVAEPR